MKIDLNGVFDVNINILTAEATQEYVNNATQERTLIMKMSVGGNSTTFYGPDGEVLVEFTSEQLDEDVINELLDKAYGMNGFGRAAGRAFYATAVRARDMVAEMSAEEEGDETHPSLH